MATFPTTETSKPSIESTLGSAQAASAFGVLEDYYFLHLLRLERKRSERSGKPFMLALLDTGNISELRTRAEVLRQIISSLNSCMRETDTIGWYEHDKIVGVIVTEIGESEASGAPIVAAKLTNALRKALPSKTFGAINISLGNFPYAGHPRTEADLIFYPDFVAVRHPRSAALRFKRFVDIVLSLFAITLLSPLFALVAALVKSTSEGPVLFRQKRVGQYGAAFTFLKFRSMYANNDPRIHEEYVAKLIAGKDDVRQPGSQGGVFKLTNDPRITPLGKMLRRSSLDELPQLFNVLHGEMSLVGPRPPVLYEFEHYDAWHKRRVLEVKPGITGLWQVHGRSKTSFDEMVRLDLKYAREWSIWLDLKILLKTPLAVLSGDGAH